MSEVRRFNDSMNNVLSVFGIKFMLKRKLIIIKQQNVFDSHLKTDHSAVYKLLLL